MVNILIVDDSDEIREVIKTILTLKNFSVLEAYSGKQALNIIQKGNPDMVILDLILPDIDGTEICKTLKANPKTSSIPVLMLTARTGIYDRVKGLEMGADDYLIKPFDTMELLARVNALLRRSGIPKGVARVAIKTDKLNMDPGDYSVSINGKSVTNLTPREFDILYILSKNSPRAVTRDEIFESIWEKNANEKTRVIDIHIARIRKKIGQEKIKTIPGKGYLLST